MLKNIPNILSPEMLKALSEMGHGDEIVIADGNFPSASICSGVGTPLLLRADGHTIPTILEAVIGLIPLDTYSEKNICLMQVVPGDNCKTPIWDEYKHILSSIEKEENIRIEAIERFAFYERAKKAYAVIATSESAQYANIIITKGVI
ncbi:MAG: fucose isomerase [Spirochaetaceae bacterium]|jgi:L-fucose mutarotase|nr:fucose isomerase [Spirochaetaceae bacterium]